MILARPLDRFPLVRTTSVEEVREALAHIYAKPILEPEKRIRALEVSANHYELGHVGLHYNKYGAAVSVDFPEADYFLQIFSIRGKGEAIIDKISVLVVPDRGAVISPNAGYQAHWDADFERLVLKIDAEALTRKLAVMTEVSIGRTLRMEPVPNFTRPAMRFLRDSFLFLVDMVDSSAVPLPKLVLAEFEQTLMALFLHANQHDYSHLLEQTPPCVAPWQVRRAEEYIEANWNEPMSIEAIAAASGVSIRSLFRTFRQSRGYSPMEFVKQVRLRHARDLLRRPDVTTTITQAAFACGFGDLSHFSKDYCQTFGERPSETLKRSRNIGSAHH
jgi:AraC-like DNA-binding protein